MEFKKYKLCELASVDISSVDKKSKEGEKPVRLCNFTDVYKNWAITRYHYSSLMKATAKDRDIDKFCLRKGQVAITKDSETRDDIGIPTYIADDFEDVVLGYHCALITPNENLDGKYLNAYLNSKMAKKYFEGYASGSGQRYTLTLDSINEIQIWAPDIDSQRELVKILSDLDKKIALNTRMNAELEAMAKQLYDYWFVQFDFPDENGKPYKSSGGKMVYNEKLKREIPEGWEDSILSEIANITMGQSPDGSSYNEEGNGSVFYQGSTDFGIRFPSVRMFTTEPSRFAEKGDILMSVRAPVGDTNIANKDCCIGRGLAALNSKIGSITYLYFILDYLKAKFDLLNSVGTTFGAITKDELFTLPVIKPDDDVLKCFENICSPIFDKQMNIGFEINELTRLRDSLLPMLMNGQVTVE